MNQRPDDQDNQTEAIPQQADDTAQIDAADTARMPSASDAPDSPSAVDGAGAIPPSSPVRPAASAASGTSPWWKGRLALAGGALAAGLLLGGAVGATTAVAVRGTDDVTQVTEGGRGGFDGEGRPPGGRHGGGMGELPQGEGQLPGGGQGELPGGGTSTDPNDANGTDQAT
jgi:hypothetical protein